MIMIINHNRNITLEYWGEGLAPIVYYDTCTTVALGSAVVEKNIIKVTRFACTTSYSSVHHHRKHINQESTLR